MLSKFEFVLGNEPFAARSTCPPVFVLVRFYCAKTVRDKKINKIFLDSYDDRVFQDYVLEDVAQSICSHEHLISNFCTGHYT